MWVVEDDENKLYAYHAFPPLSATDVGPTSATLLLSGHTGSWWLKRTAPSEGACTAGEADFSHAVGGLMGSTTYTYTAYSKTGCTSADAIDSVTFSTPGPGDRKAGQDFHALNAAGNNNPFGVWSDGVTTWVADWVDGKIYAYKRSDKSRDSSKDFDTLSAAGNSRPVGLWSDGTTMWVADYDDDKIYAYKLSDKSRDSSKDFNTLSAAGNNDVLGLWSDGTTMWVADDIDDKLYAYKLSDKTRDSSKDFKTLSAAGNTWPYGLWSDGVTMWVADRDDAKIYAYKLSDKSRDAARDFDTLSAAGNDVPTGLWSDGVTMWVADVTDAKLYAYYAFPKLTAAADTLTSATLTLSNSNYGSSWWLKQTSPTPAGACTAGEADFSHAVSGLMGNTTYTYKAYKAAGCASADEIGSLTFSTPGPGDRKAAQDFDTLAALTDNPNPWGLWSDGVTMWVASRTDNKIYAYKRSDMSRDAAKDFDLHSDITASRGIWSDGVTMWVANYDGVKLYAYKLSDQSRDAAKDFNLHSDNANLWGLWSDGVTLWVADSDHKLYAYKLSDQSRDAAKDIDLHSDNTNLRGIWSDGVTMWVADYAGKLYAYKLSDGSRDAARDFDTLSAAGNTSPRGIWSDGVTMWVVEDDENKLYAYHAFPSLTASAVAATSATLTLSNSNYGSNWWLKKTSPTPAGTCTAGEADFSHALSSLTASTTYTYKAYRDSGCTSANEIADVTFTTPSS